MRKVGGKKLGPRFGGVMSLEEIAEEMGITPQGAGFLYRNALKKLRRKPQAMRLLRDLIQLKEQTRASQ